MSDLPILVVEDEPDGQEVVSRLLAVMNIPLEMVDNGEDAWVMLQNHTHKAAVIDLALPGMDGIDLVRHIRSDPSLSSLPCIAITAYHTPELKQQAIAEGFNIYFAKPLNKTLLLEALDSLFSNE